MKWLGFRQVQVKTLKVDAVDIKRRQTRQHVVDLAKDIAEHGGEPIHAPTMRQGPGTLLCGRDRFAASLLNKAKKLWVHVVECDDDEAKALELAENIYRRADNRAELITQLVRLKEQHLRAEDEAKRAAGEKVSEADKDSPKARARREVARAAGVSTATVKSHEKRVAKSAEEAENYNGDGGQLPPHPTKSGTDAGPAEVELPKGFQTFGLEVAAGQRDAIDSTSKWLGDFEGYARKILRDLTEMEKHGIYVVSHAHVQAIRERAEGLGHAVREAMPAGLCFYCKGRPGLVERCNGCGGKGVVGRHAGDHVPAELRSAGEVYVAIDGKAVKLAEVEAGAAASPPARANGRAKKIRVEDADGRELTYVPDEEGPAL